MFIIKFIRYLLGYVEFKVTGGFIERFLNMCNLNSIKMWDLKISNSSLVGFTDIKSYKKMHTYAHRSGNVVKIKNKFGLPFITHRYKYRVGLVAGFVIFVAIISLLTRFVWSIEVEGNKDIPTETIIEFFDDQGLSQGTNIDRLNLEALQSEAMSHFKSISWIHINTYSGKVVIEMREAVALPKQVDPDEPYNIKATVDGQIVKMTVFSGYPMVQVGDSVIKGDLLVSGIKDGEKTGNTYYKHANAEVIALTEREITAAEPCSIEEKDYTGKSKFRSYIDFFNMKIPLYIGGKPEGNYEKQEKETKLKLWGTVIPITFYRVEYMEYSPRPREQGEEELKNKCIRKIEKEIKKIETVRQVVSIDYTPRTENGTYYLTALCTFHEEIGTEEKIVISDEQPVSARPQR